MPTSIRENIMTTVKNRLARITTANSYETNAGNNIVEGMVDDPNPNKTPIINVYDADDVYSPEHGRYAWSLTVVIEAYDTYRPAQNRSFNTVARLLRTDIEKAMLRSHTAPYGYDPTLDGLAQEIFPEGGQVLVDPTDSCIAGVIRRYRIVYGEGKGDPYNK